MRLTATEVARNPGAERFLPWNQGMEELWQLVVLLLFGSDDKLVDFIFQLLCAVCLDYAVDGAEYVFAVNVLLVHIMMSFKFCPL